MQNPRYFLGIRTSEALFAQFNARTCFYIARVDLYENLVL